MKNHKDYYLIHVTAGGEYKTPLVASQLFDQAQTQAEIEGDFQPSGISCWIIDPFRSYFDSNSSDLLKKLKYRCPKIKIKLIGGISRLKNFPSSFLMFIHRILVGKDVVIYHCRGETAFNKIIWLKKWFKKDLFILDVRGYWPAELLYKLGITEINNLEGDLLIAYQNASLNLFNSIQKADAVTTVSENLKSLLIRKYKSSIYTSVVPCCIKNIADDFSRNNIREKFGFSENDKVIVYSGTTARYQHLEDLTLPFLKTLMLNDNRIKLLLLTPDKIKMQHIVESLELPSNKTTIFSVPQEEVAQYLSCADVGVLIRKPSLVNQVAQPVKIAEYLAAGLILLIEKNSGGIPIGLSEQNLTIEINTTLYQENPDLLNEDIKNVILKLDFLTLRKNAQEFAKNYFLWKNAIKTHRLTYKRLLHERIK